MLSVKGTVAHNRSPAAAGFFAPVFWLLCCCPAPAPCPFTLTVSFGAAVNPPPHPTVDADALSFPRRASVEAIKEMLPDAPDGPSEERYVPEFGLE